MQFVATAWISLDVSYLCNISYHDQATVYQKRPQHYGGWEAIWIIVIELFFVYTVEHNLCESVSHCIK